ncbi:MULTISPECIES: hypothetical protein [Parachlamydia]|uniref:hypothetical protein n=1 Tax=Parachlamydia TaxID=83551 RepID=UPI001F4959A6|nr:hypothetical protein [Parachlamydia acanthamoebae]
MLKRAADKFVSEVFVRFRIGVIVLIGRGESLVKEINIIAINMIGIFSDEMLERGELEACFFKGVVVSVYALARTGRAFMLIMRIEGKAMYNFMRFLPRIRLDLRFSRKST